MALAAGGKIILGDVGTESDNDMLDCEDPGTGALGAEDWGGNVLRRMASGTIYL